MTFTLTIEMDNAAFEDGLVALTEILGNVGLQAEAGHRSGVATDVNGNRVGSWEIK